MYSVSFGLVLVGTISGDDGCVNAINNWRNALPTNPLVEQFQKMTKHEGTPGLDEIFVSASSCDAIKAGFVNKVVSYPGELHYIAILPVIR